MNLVEIKENRNNIVVKHKTLVHNARYKLSETSLKIVAILISMIKKDDKDFKEYHLKISDFRELIGTSSKNIDTYKYTHKIIRELMSDPFVLDDVNLNWISSGKHIRGSGLMVFKIDPNLKPYLVQLKNNFLQYNIVNILPLKSTYVIRFYEICKDKMSENSRYIDRDTTIFKIKIDEIRELFQLPKSYQYSSGIKLRILDKAVIQFKEKTDIQMSYKELKIGRKVHELEITIKSNNKGSNDFIKSRESFIKYIRVNHINTDLYAYRDIAQNKNIILSCATDGRVYNKMEPNKALDKNLANQVWDSLYELAKKGELKI